MKIEKIEKGNCITIFLEGRLDTNTAPELEKEVDSLYGVNTLIFDLEKLEYMSSAGLRIILSLQKKMMNMQGKMIIKNVRENIKEVFDITGFSDILTIE